MPSYYKRIIVKVGTSTLTNGTKNLDAHYIDALTTTFAKLRELSIQPILVTSGATGAGQSAIGVSLEEMGTSYRQILASIGQVQLMTLYQQSFAKHTILCAQVLLTLDDFRNRKRYLNIRNTLQGLLERGVIPVINENDVVATDEIEGVKIGDNDTLSAYVAAAVDADILVILSDIDGLYTANPQKDPTATLIREIPLIDMSVDAMIDDKNQEKVFFGGMKTKIKAARVATENGTELIIAKGSNPDILLDIVEKKEEHSTRFLPREGRKHNRKKWLTSFLDSAKAILTLDENAVKAIAMQKSLLPAGIINIEGKANRGDPVLICSPDGVVIAKGLLEYPLSAVDKIKGKRSNEIIAILGYSFGDEVVHKDNLVLMSL